MGDLEGRSVELLFGGVGLLRLDSSSLGEKI